MLHQKKLVRLLAAAAAFVVLGGAISARDHLIDGATGLVGQVQRQVGDAGFGITAIEISGQTLSDEANVIALLGIGADGSTLDFDVEKARTRLHWLRAVDSATVRKVYPGRLVVTLKERTPVARWRKDGITYLVDGEGRRIGEDRGAYADLPLVVGEGAADDALAMIRSLDRFAGLKEGLLALSRVGDRRWDMIYRTGLKVRLPETGVAQALVQLEAYQRDYALLERDVTEIDLRVPGLVALVPSEAAQAELKAARSSKRPTHRANVDSSYETPAERGSGGGH